MKFLSLKFSLAIILGFLSIPAFAGSLDLCKIVQSKLQASLPQQKDKYTFVTNTGCVQGSPKHRFVYMLEIRGLSKTQIIGINFNKDLKEGGLNQFCSDPNMRVLLNAFDVDHRYYDSSSVFLGSFLMSSKECPR
jgi:hypothetical protein